MKLKSLNMNASDWGDNKGRIIGSVVFTSPLGEVKINLSQDQIKGILTVCAEAVVVSAKEVAENLTATVIDQSALEQTEGTFLIETPVSDAKDNDDIPF